MFSAETNNPTILQTSFNAINNIVDIVKIECDNEGIRLNAIDRSHIIFVHFELKSSYFTQYTCNEPVMINLDTTDLMKVLKRGKSSDMVELLIDETNLIIKFSGESTRTFKIRMISDEIETPTAPNIPYTDKISIPVKLLKDTLADISIFSDKVNIKQTPEYLCFNAEGNFGDTNIKYVHGEEVTEEAESLFSLDKLQDMLRADKFTDTAILELGENAPLTLTLEMITGDGCISFLLAPRLDTEE